MNRILSLLLAIILLAMSASAQVPRTMNVQGVLTDAVGIPLVDGNYSVQFKLWDALDGGTDIYTETILIPQEGGVFNAVLGSVDGLDSNMFSQSLWMSLAVAGQAPGEPRIGLTSVATAIRAASVDHGAAVRSLNGITDHVNIQAGANIAITYNEATMVISATAGAGGDDGDWLINGDNISRATGRVYVGYDPAKSDEFPMMRGSENDSRDPVTSKLTVLGENEGFSSTMQDIDNLADDRHAIFGRRARSARNDGIGYGIGESNTAITGYNDWGDSFTFGVAGFTWFDFNETGGVMGANNSGNTWASLAYRDNEALNWGMYTPNDVHVGGLTQTAFLRVTGGATDGYVLTSDASGYATWQAPGSGSGDDDWVISGDNMYHSAPGAVAVGTVSAHNHGNSTSRTTMQVSALYRPTLALDAIFGGLTRWTMAQDGSGGIEFKKSSAYSSYGTTALALEAGKMELKDYSGNTKIRLESEGDMTTGSSMSLYSASSNTSQALIYMSAQNSLGAFGGLLTLRNGTGHSEIIITANHNGTSEGRITTPVLEITGGSDLSEQFDVGNTSLLTKPGMVVSIDPQNPGQLTPSNTAYDRRVAGVISGAGGVNTGMLMGQKGSEADGEFPVALVGRVYVWADATNGPIEPGDLLTTSDRPGHAMRVSDHGQATGAILGKAMTGLAEGQGLILTLVALQ